jgi:hypothetical protein
MRTLTFGLCLLALDLASAQTVATRGPETADEIAAFMQAAKVVRSRELSTGITRPLRLTLSDGHTTHDAVFQAVDQKLAVFTPQRGPAEINFVDSWRYNVAGYRLATLLGLESMAAVTIEYRYQGKTGALAWFRESMMDERKRMKEKIRPPDVQTWNHDMYNMRVFTALVRDTDRNLGNVLISPDWRVIMVDFTRAFRLHPTIDTKEIHQCERGLLTRLEALTLESLQRTVGEYLTKPEAEAVMKRRDLIVAHIRTLIAERGEEKVLY